MKKSFSVKIIWGNFILFQAVFQILNLGFQIMPEKNSLLSQYVSKNYALLVQDVE